MPATGARLGTGKPAVNVGDPLPFFLGHRLQDGQKLSESQVTHLSTPETLHRFQIQRLKHQYVKLVCQSMGQFPEPVLSTIRDVLIAAY